MTPSDAVPWTRRRLLVLLLVVLPLTVVGYLFMLGATAFTACGISGCSGGGFGASYSPTATQVCLVLTGVTLVPLVVLALHGRRPRYRATAGVLASVLGSLAAMVVLDLGPNGCPEGLASGPAGPGSFFPGARTCLDGR